MFQIVLTWNLSKPNQHIDDLITDIDIRGYRKRDIILPSEYSNKIRSHELKSLSVSNIADKICPKRRDLYYRKGANPPNDVPHTDSWGSKAGSLIEQYLEKVNGVIDINPQNYSNILEISNRLHDDFIRRKSRNIGELTSLEKAGEEGNTNWLQSLLNCDMRAELGAKVLHALLKEEDTIDFSHIYTKRKLHPNVLEIGISDGVEPDFILPDFGIVGDIKTGVQFEPHHQLTCAGYALAYENEMKWKHKNKNINWGIVYFIQTRLEHSFVKSLTLPQIYIFPIDNYLRETFLTLRTEGYRITSEIRIPDFPETSEREKCQFCRYFAYCQDKGLEWP